MTERRASRDPQTHADKPLPSITETGALLLGYLDYYRSVIAAKITGLSDAQLRSTPLPSGWTPLGLLNHLVHMERRWFRWGFLAENINDLHGDGDESGGPWSIPDDATLGN